MEIIQDEDPHKIEALRAAIRPLLEDFLTRMDLVVPEVYTINPDVEALVKAITKHWPDQHLLRPHINSGIYLACISYRNVSSIEVQTEIALYTALIAAFDDPAIMSRQPCGGDFTKLYISGAIRPDMGLFAELAACIGRLRQHYSHFAANAITTSTLDAMSAMLLTSEMMGSEVSADAAPFLEYRRHKTGSAAAYALFAWDAARFPDDKIYAQALPDMSLWVRYCKDVLSFYKENTLGETGTYLTDRAAVEQKTRSEALREVIDDTIALTRRIQRNLGEAKARDAWDAFMGLYTGFHLVAPRYRLQEVMGLRCRIEGEVSGSESTR